MRKFFEKYGKPTWYVDRLIYTFPLHMAAKFNTPMLCYGENVSFEYGGNADKGDLLRHGPDRERRGRRLPDGGACRRRRQPRTT